MSSNYPNGFANGVTIRGLPLQQVHPGEVFWVNSTTVLAKRGVGGSDGNKGTYREPFATLEFALSQTTASRGDVIVLMPGYTQTVGTATALNFDVAGVAIIGLGSGTLRPTITFDTANTATIPVTADNISITNVAFIGNFLSIASCFTPAAAAWFTVENCDFSDTSATLGFLSIVTTTVSVNADFLNFNGNRVRSIATTTPGPALDIDGTMTGLTVQRNRVSHSTVSENEAALVNHAALVMTDALISDNTIYSINIAQTTDGLVVKTSATTGSGIIARNFVRSQDPGSAIGIVTAAAVQYGSFENFHTGETTQLSGVILPARGAN